jgi:endonuclease/exonuclease/phosphatase family metal-dependent hydrolase
VSATCRILTYNVRCDSPEDRGSDAWESRRDAVAGTVRLHRPDIVGIQEPFHSQVTDLSERLPDFTLVGKGRGAGETEGEYVPIGYRTDRFTLVERDTFWLSPTPSEPGSVGWDAEFPRVVTMVRLRDEATETEVVCFNTHFDHVGEVARLNGAALLRSRLEAVPTEVPFVLTGDFNCGPSSRPFRILTADLPAFDRTPVHAKKKCQLELGPKTSTTDFATTTSGPRIDHVFVSPDLAVNTYASVTQSRPNGRFPSDHLPVVTVIEN